MQSVQLLFSGTTMLIHTHHGLFLEATYVGDLAIEALKSGWLKLFRA